MPRTHGLANGAAVGRHLLRFGAVAALTTLLAPACNLVIDANVHDPDAVAAAARGDAGSTPSDGGLVGDAAGRDATADDAGLTRGCAAEPPRRFCEEFEDSAAFEPTWTLNAGGSSTIARDPLGFGGTRGVKMGMTGASACSFARLDKDWEDTKATTAVEAHFKVRPSSSAPSGDGEVNVVAFQIDEAGSTYRCSAILSVAPEQVTVILQTPPPSTDERRLVAGKIPFDAWSEVGLKLVEGTPRTLVVTVRTEGGAVEETTLQTPQCPNLGGAVRLGLGLHCETGTAEARYDDVWVDWR